MIHFFKRFCGIQKEELELLVPDILTQLVPLHLCQTDDHFIVQTVEFSAIACLVADDLTGAFADR